MKRSFFFFSFLAVAVCPAWAYSTCETRVDNNPWASTPQRVMYCLNEEDPYEVQPVPPRVLYTEVMLEEEKQKPVQTRVSDNNPYFRMDRYSVTRDYVGTPKFPEFQNSLLSEQEIWAANHPYQSQPQPQQEVAYTEATQWQEPVSYQTQTTTTTTKKRKSGVRETRKGLSRRMQKAQRRNMANGTTQVQETVVTTTVTEQYPVTDVSNPYAVPVETDNFLEQENLSVPENI